MLLRGTLFDTKGGSTEQETVEPLLERTGVRVERIVSTGQGTPAGRWYDQAWDEWVALLGGSATLRFADDSLVDMAPGDWVLIPAGLRHRVEATSADPPAVWLAVHAPPGPAPGGGG